jgi:transposase
VINLTVKEAINAVISTIKEQIKKLEIERKKIVEEHEPIKYQVEKITDVNGVGLATACCLLAETPTPENFANAKQYAAFVGVTPSHFQSGTSVKGKSRISKLGSRKVRKVLYMSALVAKNHNKHFSEFVKKLEKKGKATKVIIVAIMRKLMHLFYGMMKNNSKFDENLAFNA